MKKIFAFFIIFLSFFSTSKAMAADVAVEVNANQVLTEDFGQLLGGYLGTRRNLDPNNRIVLSTPAIIEAAKKIFPRLPEFTNDVVVRNQSYYMLSNDYFVMTDAEVEDVINFCSQAGCDPMFGAIGEGSVHTIEGKTGKVISAEASAIKKRVAFVKEKCRQYFGDDKHCRHWDIGNEPPTTPQHCDNYGKNLIPSSAKAVKEIMPEAIIHAPELFSDSAKVRDSEMTIGECILKKVSETDPNLKIDVVTTHWYPYVCVENRLSALGIDGNAILNWNGFGLNVEKMKYPYDIVSGMSGWMSKYNSSKNSVIGLGELNPMASCQRISDNDPPGRRTTEIVNTTWGAAFWHLDELGIIADAGIKYSQKHVSVGGSGGQYELMIPSGNQVIKTPPYFAYQFYSQYFAARAVKSVSSNKPLLNSHASVDKKGNLRVLLINKSGGVNNGNARSLDVQIKLNNFSPGEVGEAYKMKSPGDFNTGGGSENVFSTETQVVVDDVFQYKVPAYTAVIIKIPKSSTLLSPGAPTNTPVPAVLQIGDCPAVKPSRSLGNANCDDNIDNEDFDIWKEEFLGTKTTKTADFNKDDKVDGVDYIIWWRNRE